MIKFDGNKNKALVICQIEDEANIKLCIEKLLKSQNRVAPKEYYYEGIHKDLKLKQGPSVPHPYQKGANCAWDSAAKPSFRGIVYAHCLQKKKSHADAVKISKSIYKNWVYHDRKQSIQDFLALPLEDPQDQVVRRQILACIYHCLTTEHPSTWKQEIIDLIKNEVILNATPSFKITEEGTYSYRFD